MSSAVTAPPADDVAAASSEVAVKADGASTRSVIECPGLGLAAMEVSSDQELISV